MMVLLASRCVAILQHRHKLHCVAKSSNYSDFLTRPLLTLVWGHLEDVRYCRCHIHRQIRKCICSAVQCSAVWRFAFFECVKEKKTTLSSVPPPTCGKTTASTLIPTHLCTIRFFQSMQTYMYSLKTPHRQTIILK